MVQYPKLIKFCIKNSIRYARTPQPGEIVFNTMRYRSSETVQSSGAVSEQCESCKAPNNVEPGEIFFNTMRYRNSETVHRLGYFQSTACED